MTTDSVDKNLSVADGLGIEFSILSDADGTVLKALKMWDQSWKIAQYGYFLLDPDLRVVSNRRGNWEPTEAVKRFFLNHITGAAVSRDGGESRDG